MRAVVPGLALVLVLLVGGCAGGAPPTPAPAARLHVGFGGLVDTIEVRAVDRLPLRRAELVAPDGTATEAQSLDAIAAPRVAGGQTLAANPWQSALSGSGSVRLTRQAPGAGAAMRSEEQLMAVVSKALITLPQPIVYRRDWRRYRIRLVFGTPPGAVETRVLPAPKPPPL